jgi:hypothetical protein
MDDFMSCFNNIFDQESIEKFFQREVVRFTIENFCKFLKNNDYTIIKNNEVNKNSENQDILQNLDEINNINNNNSNSNAKELEMGLSVDNNNIGSCNNIQQSKKMKEIICPHTDKKHYAKVI